MIEIKDGHNKLIRGTSIIVVHITCQPAGPLRVELVLEKLPVGNKNNRMRGKALFERCGWPL